MEAVEAAVEATGAVEVVVEGAGAVEVAGAVQAAVGAAGAVVDRAFSFDSSRYLPNNCT